MIEHLTDAKPWMMVRASVWGRNRTLWEWPVRAAEILPLKLLTHFKPNFPDTQISCWYTALLSLWQPVWLCKCLRFHCSHTHTHTQSSRCSGPCSVGRNLWVGAGFTGRIGVSIKEKIQRGYGAAWPPAPASISVANIDPFVQSDLIEGSPFFVLNGQRTVWVMERWFYPHEGEEWLISWCL